MSRCTRRAAITTAITVAALWSCADGPQEPRDPVLRVDVIVSDGVPIGAMTANATIGSQLQADRPSSSLSFISMRPGTMFDASSLRITGPTGVSRTVTLYDGGIDPVPVAATGGDQVTVEAVRNGQVVAMASARVPEDVPPVIVRTAPRKRRTGVPVNLVLRVFFSEPVDRTSVTAAAVRLTTDGSSVSGALEVDSTGTVVSFRPTSPLQPDTWYTLQVNASIRDLSGLVLAQPESIDFQTARASTSLVKLCPDTLHLPVGTTSGFLVVVDSGQRVINTFPDSSLTWGGTDPAIVLVDEVGGVSGIAIGQAYATVTYRGVTDSALVVVGPWPPPGPYRVQPDGASLALGTTVPFVVSHPAGTPEPAVQWTSRDPSVARVDASGRATAVGGGTTFVVGVSGTDIDSADVEVIEPDWAALPSFDIYAWPRILLVGETEQYTTSLLNLGDVTPTWRSSDPATATVDQTGAVQALGPGVSIIDAQLFRLTDSITIQVLSAEQAGTVVLSPDEVTLDVRQSLQFTAVPDSVALSHGFTGQWVMESVDGGALFLPQTGLARALVPGTARVIFRMGAAADTATVHIR